MDNLTSAFNTLNIKTKKLGPSARTAKKASTALKIRQSNFYNKKNNVPNKVANIKKTRKTKNIRRNSTDTVLKDIINILKIS